MNKYGYKKFHAVILFVQMLLIVLGTAMILYGIIGSFGRGEFHSIAQISRFSVLIAFVSVIMYSIIGYRKRKAHYYGAVYAFSASVLLTIMRGGSSIENTVNALIFGLILAFSQVLGKKRHAVALITVVCFLLLSTAVYRITGFILAGNLSFPKLCNNMCQVILSGTVEVMYLTDSFRESRTEQSGSGDLK